MDHSHGSFDLRGTQPTLANQLQRSKRKEMTDMASLDDLLDIEGVATAGEFTADGQLVDYKARMDM